MQLPLEERAVMYCACSCEAFLSRRLHEEISHEKTKPVRESLQRIKTEIFRPTSGAFTGGPEGVKWDFMH